MTTPTDPAPYVPSCALTVLTSSGVVEVAGELDMATSPILGAALAGSATPDHSVSVDLSAVTFIDAAGIRALAAHIDDGGQIEIPAVSPIVRRLLDLVGSVHGVSVGVRS